MINDDDFSLYFNESDRLDFLGNCSTPVEMTASPASSAYDTDDDFPTPDLFDSLGHGQTLSFNSSDLATPSSAPAESENLDAERNAPVSHEDDVARDISLASSSSLTHARRVEGWTILTFDPSQRRAVKRDVRSEVSADSSSSKRARSTGILRTKAVKETEFLLAQLKQFKIDPKDYENSFKKLEQLGYGVQEINKLVISKYRNKIVEKLIKNHSILMKLIRDDELGHQDLVQVCAREGGYNNIDALIDYYKLLKGKGYSPKNIIGIVSHKGGAANLRAVLDNHDTLSSHGFSVRQIAHMASGDGGSCSLKAVSVHYDALKHLNLSHDQIDRAAAHHGGSSIIKTIVKTLGELIKDDTFSIPEIVRFVSRDGGSGRLKALAKNQSALLGFGFTKGEVIRMASKTDAYPRLSLIVEFCQNVPAHYFSTRQIADLVCKGWAYFEAYRTDREGLVSTSSEAAQSSRRALTEPHPTQEDAFDSFPGTAGVYNPTFFGDSSSRGLLPETLECPLPTPLFADTRSSSPLFDGCGSFFCPRQSRSEQSWPVESDYPDINLF